MSGDEAFNLRSIFEDSISDIEDLAEVHNYLLALSEDELTSSLTNGEISDISKEILRKLLGADFIED